MVMSGEFFVNGGQEENKSQRTWKKRGKKKKKNFRTDGKARLATLSDTPGKYICIHK